MPNDDPYLAPLDPATKVKTIAQQAGIRPDIADDYLNVTGGIESGNQHYDRRGQVKRSPAGALGFGQLTPDQKGRTTKMVGGRTYNLLDEGQNIEAGLRYFAQGGDDPVRRRIAYLSGQKSAAVKYYDRTGKIPRGGDPYTGVSFAQYVQASKGQQAPSDPYLTPLPNQTAPAAQETDDPYLAPLPQEPSKATGMVPGMGAAQQMRQRPTTRVAKPSAWGKGTIGQGVKPVSIAPKGISAARVEGEAQPSEATQVRGALRNVAASAGLPTGIPTEAGDWINEAIYQGAGQLLKAAGGVGKNRLMVSPVTSATEYLANRAGISPSQKLKQAGQEIGANVQAADEDAKRGFVSQTAKDLVAGSVGSSPAMILTALGVPAPVAFGLQSNLEAEGSDASFKDVVKETAKGATIGALFDMPVPAKLSMLQRLGYRAGTVGAGTFGLEKLSGADTKHAATSALINGAFAATGAGKEKSSLSRGLDREIAREATREPTTTPRPEVPEVAAPVEVTKPAEAPQEVGAVKIGEPVSHPNPAIDGRPIIAQMDDGRVVVPNEGNKTRVSVVKHQPEQVQSSTATPEPATEELIPSKESAIPPATEPPLAAQPVKAETTATIPEVQETAPRITEAEAAKGVPVKTAAIEAERAEAGLNPIEKQQYRNIGESFLRGKDAVEKGDIDPRKVATEVASTERPLTADEVGALGYDRARLQNEYDVATAKINEAVDKGDAQGVAAGRAELDEIQRLADVNDAALEKGGREQSIAFNARKMIVGRDYSLLGIIQRAKAAKGEKLTPQEEARYQTLEKQLAEAEKKIATYESAKPDRALRRIISETERQARREKRAVTKQELDTEFAALRQQFAQARAEIKNVQPSGLAGLDPEGKLTKIVAQMARNRVLAGFNTVDGLVDELHSQLKDYVEDKRDIRDLFSGYGREPKPRTKDEITVELNRLKQEARRMSKAEDRNPVTEAAKKEAAKQKAVKTRLTKQIADLENQLRTGDFTKPQRPKLEYDREAEQLLAHRDLLKDRIEREIAKQKKPLPEDYLTWWQQGTILSGSRTLSKLGSYALGKNIIIPIEDVISGAMSHVPGLRGLSEASPRYGGGIRENIEAQGAAFKEFVNKAMYRDAWTSLKEGTNALKLKHGDNRYQYTPRLLTFIRGLHMAEKVFASRPEYFRAIEKETQWAVRNGLNPQDPKVQAEILSRSYMNGLRAQLMQPNIPSKLLSTTNAWLESVGRTGKIGQIQEPGVKGVARAIRTGIRAFFPITRVPFNYVNEALSYNPVGGLAKGGARLGAEALKTIRAKGFGKGITELAQEGMRNMPPEAADATKRALIKGSLGVPLALIGWYNYKNIGGYYQPGQRKEGDVPFGGFRIGGYDIPRALVHNPVFETMHFFATMRRVYEGEKEGGDYYQAAKEATKGTIEEVPFLDVPQRIEKARAQRSGPENLAGELVRGATIPPDIQRVAAVSDTAVPTTKTQKALQIAGLKDIQTVKRKPEGFVQTYMMGVPGLRQRVPINERAQKQARDARLIEDFRSGKITKDDLDAMRESDVLTKSEAGYDTVNPKTGEVTHHEGTIEKRGAPERSPTQISFENAPNDKALERYERLVRLKDPRAFELQDTMAKKAWSLTHSDALTEKQKEEFQRRIDALGITPVDPRSKKQSNSSVFGEAFKKKKAVFSQP